MKLHWLLTATCISIVLYASPSQAAQLQSWRFDRNLNRLEISTVGDVQPQAQLVFNPTRLVIDLPNTRFGRSQVTETVGGAIRAVRIGQFDEQTTRVVVELTPGYNIDPKQIKFVGITPSRWTIQLPPPEKDVADETNIYNIVTTKPNISNPNTSNPNISNPNISNPSIPNRNPINRLTPISAASRTTQIEYLQVTGDGFFLRTRGMTPRAVISRTLDRGTINIDIADANILPQLQKDMIISKYGVNRVQFSQIAANPPTVRMSMQVNRNSPDWRVNPSAASGLVILPTATVIPSPGSNNPSYPSPIASAQATIQAVEISPTGRQLIIRSDRNLRGSGGWDRSTGLYRIVVPNARLAPAVQGPQLSASSPILRIRLQQQDSQTVVILVQPAAGVQIGELNQIGDRFIALNLERSNPSPQIPPISLPLPRPNPQPDPIVNPNPNPNPNPLPRPRGKILVVIDPGHGGKDSGAPSPNLSGFRNILEKDVVLAISKRVESVLERNGVQVLMTRNSDFFVELKDRVVMSERARATLFVSIHANSVDSRPDVNGLEVYYYFDNSYQLADTVRQTILSRIDTLRNRGTRKARFYVIRKGSMPSILVETGYMSGREDNPRLASPEYQNRMADAIAEGILKYLGRR
ncbi:N-acetylmuramoyl-L-alanine amidase [Calothrix sp. 336/3]|uniref:N-acetylmuramoyl-L-alanine amidase n=1 Tax=Calothrix sp. 336/3 TaxID=1337936 RepID=UPI0004E3814B|nr:N-acetylmuramoyl-L-alanine amidase [Calothrix sp. 336/3]AKG22848.1 N-acetylmuramoyl-L-alanine amidase [Calothrix sp. 336/3]